MEEIWKDIPGYEGYYQASSLGRIRAIERTVPGPRFALRFKSRIKALTPGPNGYLLFHASRLGEKRMMYVHRCVLMAFAGLPKPSWQANHKNSNRQDNRLENLEWVTPRENVIHSITSGFRVPHGEGNPNARLSAADLPAIRARIAAGESCRVIGLDYGVKATCIQKIKEGRTWKNAA